MPTTEPALLTIPEVARELRVSRATVYRYFADGDLKRVRLGAKGHWRVERAEVDAFIERNRHDKAAS
jgi:excisionase family DNA binding protein